VTIIKLLYTFKLNNNESIILPVGVKKMKIRNISTGSTIIELGTISSSPINQCVDIEFPIVNGKSPCKFTSIGDGNTYQLLITELGGTPDPNYFSDEPTVIPEIIPDEPTEQEVNNDAV
jgi:hypothetical protein